MLGNVCGLEVQQAFVVCRLVRAVSSSEGERREWEGSRADKAGVGKLGQTVSIKVRYVRCLSFLDCL